MPTCASKLRRLASVESVVLATDAGGTPSELRGVQPDVRVEHADGGDPTFEKALKLLRERSGRAVGPRQRADETHVDSR